ncbi:MAG: hypothetical protein V4805_04755 [Pseudomonadota bacterium]
MNVKSVILVSLAMIALIATAGVLLVVVGPSDVVTNRYPTLAAARADKLFERGWLPEILPPSTFQIDTLNNLDLDTSAGRFSFNAAEWTAFKNRLAVGEQRAPFDGWAATVGKKQAAGFSIWYYTDSNTTWAFFCKAEVAYCEYTTWTAI